MSEISPAELLRDFLLTELPTGTAVVVGEATDTQQQAGVVSVMDAGLPKLERYGPLVWYRPQLRCVAPTLARAEELGRAVYRVMNGRNRVRARMASTGQEYLLHAVNVAAGPSVHWDSPETREALLFGEVLIGLDPIP